MTSPIIAQMDIYQDCKDGKMSKKTRDTFIKLIENEKVQNDKPVLDMQDVLKNIYDRIYKIQVTKAHLVLEDYSWFISGPYQLNVMKRYINQVSSLDTLNNNEFVYLAKYANKHDKNFAEKAFKIFNQNKKLYEELPKVVSDYLINCCEEELENFEEKNGLYLYSKPKNKNNINTTTENLTTNQRSITSEDCNNQETAEKLPISPDFHNSEKYDKQFVTDYYRTKNNMKDSDPMRRITVLEKYVENEEVTNQAEYEKQYQLEISDDLINE